MKIAIVYHSETGNTKKMAEVVYPEDSEPKISRWLKVTRELTE